MKIKEASATKGDAAAAYQHFLSGNSQLSPPDWAPLVWRCEFSSLTISVSYDPPSSSRLNGPFIPVTPTTTYM